MTNNLNVKSFRQGIKGDKNAEYGYAQAKHGESMSQSKNYKTYVDALKKDLLPESVKPGRPKNG